MNTSLIIKNINLMYPSLSQDKILMLYLRLWLSVEPNPTDIIDYITVLRSGELQPRELRDFTRKLYENPIESLTFVLEEFNRELSSALKEFAENNPDRVTETDEETIYNIRSLADLSDKQLKEIEEIRLKNKQKESQYD